MKEGKKTAVKRLKRTVKPVKSKDSIFHTKQVADRQEAIDSKLKLLRGSIFGRPIVKFDIGTVRDVWVPYCYLEYDFHVERSVMFKRRGLVKEGKVAVVLDVNEMHPSSTISTRAVSFPWQKDLLIRKTER